MLAEQGLVVSELTSHIFGQLMAVHPAYDALFDSFAPPALQGNPQARGEWARQQMLLAVKASARLGLSELGTFSGSLVLALSVSVPTASGRTDRYRVRRARQALAAGA